MYRAATSRSRVRLRRTVRPAATIYVSESFPPEGLRPRIHQRKRDGDHSATCVRLHCPPIGSGGDSERRETDADARTPGILGATRHRLLLSRMSLQVAPHPSQPPAHNRRTTLRGGSLDGMDQKGDDAYRVISKISGCSRLTALVSFLTTSE